MPKYPEFKSKPIVGLKEEDWDKYTIQSLVRLENIKMATELRADSASWKASRGQRHDINSTKVYAYKGTKVGNARWGTLDLIDVKYHDTYPSLGEAAKATGMTKAAVSSIINGKIKFSKGFIFSKEKLDYPD